MLLGKRPRRPVKRTTSVTDLTLGLNEAEGERHQRPPTGTEGVTSNNSNDNNRNGNRRQREQPHHVSHQTQRQHQYQHQGLWNGYVSSAPAPAPKNPRRYSADYAMEQAHFLRACGLCKKRLGPGEDTFMYRGEVAFCSLECRQQHMMQDERKEKCSLASMKRGPPQPATKPEASGDGETVAAAYERRRPVGR